MSPVVESPRDREVGERLRAGDKEVVAEICDKYGRLAYMIAFAATGRTHDAEDIAQEAFIHLWNSRHLFDPEKGSVLVYLRGILKNLCIDAHKQRKTHASFLRDYENEKRLAEELCRMIGDSTEESRRERTVRLMIDAFRAELSEVDWVILWGNKALGYTFKELTQQLKEDFDFVREVGTVRQRARRAIARLRSVLPPDLFDRRQP